MQSVRALVQTVLSSWQVPFTHVRGYWQHRTDTFTHSSGEVRTSEEHWEPLGTQAASWRVHSPVAEESP